MKRIFRLEGEPFDLLDLADLFSTGPRTIAQHDEQYYLSVEMQDGLDDEQATAIAEDELATINGLALVEVHNYRPARVSGVSRLDPATGKISTSVYAKLDGLSIRARVSGVGGVIGPDGKAKDVPVVPKQSPGHTILDLAASIDALQRALFLYGKVDHNWRGLYMVLDAIREGTGGLKSLYAKPWANEWRIEAFKATCNSYKAIGADARHGFTDEGVDRPRLTLSEARQLIHDLIRGWIAELRSQTTT